MRFTTLDEWLTWQEAAHPNAIDLGLARVKCVAQTLGVLSPKATVITVAGTNGKGSCIAAMASLLSKAGKTFGAYTSPHIQKYNERVQCNGINASDEELCQAFDAIDQARGNISLTYFEFGTLAALYVFSQKPLDCWLLEVGLGGRLDAINIIDPQLTIITSIDIDHIDWLGDNRESIGAEKAGICRQNTPLICADPKPPQSVLDIASDLECPLYLLSKHFGFESFPSEVKLWGTEFSYVLPYLNLPPASVTAALQAMYLLGFSQQLDLFEDPVDFTDTLKSVSLAGRLQTFQVFGRTIILDVAHNPAAMQHLALQLAQRFPDVKFCSILAMMADKNLDDSLLALKPVVGSWGLTSIKGLPRAATTQNLIKALPSGLYYCFDSVKHALSSAFNEKGIQFILVTGSFYCVSEAAEYLYSLRTDGGE